MAKTALILITIFAVVGAAVNAHNYVFDKNTFFNPRYCYACFIEFLNIDKSALNFDYGNRVIQWDGASSSHLLKLFGKPDYEGISHYEKNKVWVYLRRSLVFHISPSDGKVVKTFERDYSGIELVHPPED